MTFFKLTNKKVKNALPQRSVVVTTDASSRNDSTLSLIKSAEKIIYILKEYTGISSH